MPVWTGELAGFPCYKQVCSSTSSCCWKALLCEMCNVAFAATYITKRYMWLQMLLWNECLNHISLYARVSGWCKERHSSCQKMMLKGRINLLSKGNSLALLSKWSITWSVLVSEWYKVVWNALSFTRWRNNSNIWLWLPLVQVLHPKSCKPSWSVGRPWNSCASQHLYHPWQLGIYITQN